MLYFLRTQLMFAGAECDLPFELKKDYDAHMKKIHKEDQPKRRRRQRSTDVQRMAYLLFTFLTE